MRPSKIEPTKEKFIKFRLDNRTYESFKSYCDNHNIDMSRFLRLAILSFISQEVDYENNQTNFDN